MAMEIIPALELFWLDHAVMTLAAASIGLSTVTLSDWARKWPMQPERNAILY